MPSKDKHLPDPPFFNGSAPTGKPKASDYESHINKMIVLACHRYDVFITTENPFPEAKTQDAWAVRAWAEICASAQLHHTLTDRIRMMLTGRGSHARGTLRNKTRPLIATAYGFATDGSERAKLKNLERYT
ncbi:hypothetical protein BN946_scf184962.g6 [Trametes cinnabarina]|uniref:DUF6532 domain-containing protein n=1 Tax=Pycnoporus cinnabarinus TaxID=5643 RepID=A0A060SHZ4_PYCCI|nr:hypothetical protein BN946_scf184962.g6 [Trametes cinnabarina]